MKESDSMRVPHEDSDIISSQ